MRFDGKFLADIVFFSVLSVAGVFLLREVLGVIQLNRDSGQLVVRLFVMGAPLSLCTSLAAFFYFKTTRFKWYCYISGIEVLLVIAAFYIVYKSQI